MSERDLTRMRLIRQTSADNRSLWIKIYCKINISHAKKNNFQTCYTLFTFHRIPYSTRYKIKNFSKCLHNERVVCKDRHDDMNVLKIRRNSSVNITLKLKIIVNRASFFFIIKIANLWNDRIKISLKKSLVKCITITARKIMPIKIIYTVSIFTLFTGVLVSESVSFICSF